MTGVVMLAGRGRSTAIAYNSLNREIGVDRVVIEDQVPTSMLLRRRLRKLGARKVVGQVLFRGIVVPLLGASSKERIHEILRINGLSDEPIPPSKTIHVSSVNSAETQKILQDLDPRVVVVNGTRIIAREVLSCIPRTFINTHAGITPTYRGVHGGYWALTEGDVEACGVTVHVVDAGIDTGEIIGQALIQPGAEDNFATYPYLQLAAGLPVTIGAVRAALDGTLAPRSRPARASRLWSHPTLGEYLIHRVVRGVK